MPKAISANEAKTHFSELLDYVGEHADGVIVERRGQPTAVLMSIASYEEVLSWREQQRRDQALVRLNGIQLRASARNQDFSDEDAIALADEISHELIDDMASRVEIRFERDRLSS